MLHETIKKKARRKSISAVEAEPNNGIKQKPKKREGSKSYSSDAVLTVAPLLKEMRKKFAQFRGNYQQDAHELFMSFLWGVDEEADPPSPSPPTTPNEDSESDDDTSSDEEKQVFVKTETGETISLQVPKNATVKDVQHLLAKRLNLDEDDMVLDQGTRVSSRQSSSGPAKSYSKLNFTRNLFGGVLTT